MSTRQRRRIMRTFKLDEISAVDSPAQKPAKAVLMKRDDGAKKGDAFAKNPDGTWAIPGSVGTRMREKQKAQKGVGLVDVLTSVDDGHQHGIEVNSYGDGEHYIYVSQASGPDGDSHSHELMRGPDGVLVISENAGHSHTVDADQVQTALFNSMIGKADKEMPGTPGTPADNLGTQPTEIDTMADKIAGDVSADLKKMTDTAAKLQAVIDLSPEHRAHYETLSIGKREDFLTQPDKDKEGAIEAVQKANPVTYTADDGAEYRKNDDPRLVSMVKERDEDRKEMAKFRVEAEQETFSKQADDILGMIPGEKLEKVAALRQISKIEDPELRGKALTLLENANKVYKGFMAPLGANETVPSPSDAPNSATALLGSAVAKCAVDDNLSEALAYEKILGTPTGAKLYDASRAERIRGAN